MKNLIRTAEIFILALFLGILLAPRADRMAHLTGSALRGQIQSMTAQLQASLDAATPGMAVHVATVLIAIGAVIAASFIYLLVFVPLRIHSIEREIRGQREQIQSMRSEIHLSSELLLDARRDHEAQEKNQMERELARPRLHQWTVPRGDTGESKDAGRS